MAAELNDRQLGLVMNTFVFRGADQRVILASAKDAGCITESYEKGDTVFSNEDFFRALGIILEGDVLVTKKKGGSHSLPISRLGPGEVFGAAAMFNDYDSFATVLTAESRCRIVYFGETIISRMMREDFTIAENYIKYQSNRIRFLSGKIDGLAAGSAETRLARYLLENGGLGSVAANISELADVLNIGRASLYRAMDSLAAQNVIVKTGRKIQIILPDKLKCISERND